MSKSEPVYPLLLLDTASRRPWVGIKKSPTSLEWISSEDEPSNALFETLTELQKKASFKLSEIESVAFNEGPGSMLGIRTAIMALNSWRSSGVLECAKFYSFSSLNVGLSIANSEDPVSAKIIVTDARRNSWNAIASKESGDCSCPAQPSLVSNENLEDMDVERFILKEFPVWTKIKATLHQLEYRPEKVFESECSIKLLTEVEQPKPLVLREAEYQKWNPSFKPTESAQ